MSTGNDFDAKATAAGLATVVRKLTEMSHGGG